jgi:hypothetical protein
VPDAVPRGEAGAVLRPREHPRDRAQRGDARGRTTPAPTGALARPRPDAQAFDHVDRGRRAKVRGEVGSRRAPGRGNARASPARVRSPGRASLLRAARARAAATSPQYRAVVCSRLRSAIARMPYLRWMTSALLGQAQVAVHRNRAARQSRRVRSCRRRG